MKGLFALLTLLSAAAFAQEKPPPAGPPRDFKLPPARDLSLDNGMRVTLIQYGAVPKVVVALEVRAGNIDEAADQVWMADLTGDLLLEGTASRSASQIAEQAASMGGSVEVEVSADLTEVAADVFSESAPQLVGLIADVAQHPAFPEQDFGRRRADRLRQLAVARSQQQELALERFRAALYPGHAYGRLFPKAEELQAYTAAQARAFHQANYGAARSHLYVVGRFDEAQVEAAARQAFSGWARGTPAADRPPRPASRRAVHLIDRPGALQSTIVVGMPVIDPSHPDYVRLTVMNALLGGSFSSRITRNIREDKGYTYSPFSAVSTRRRDAYWAETADVTTKDTGASLKEIFAEISRLQKEAPGEQELLGIQRYLAGTFVLRNSTRAGIVQQLRFVELNGLSDDYLRNYVRNVSAVTPQQVQQMAAKYIRDGEAAIVVVGDLKSVREQVKPFGATAE